MKKLQRIQPNDPHDTDVPVPLLLPSCRRRYFAVAVSLLLITGILLVIILSLSSGLAANRAPAGEDDAAANGNGALPLPDHTPGMDDLVANRPSSDVGAGDPDTPKEDTSAGNDDSEKQDKPPVTIEQIVLSGSAGLAFRSNGDGTCLLEGLGDCTDAFLLIPERAPNGDRVTSIAPSAFAGCTQLRAVQLPASLQSIDARAFEGCSNVALFCVSPGNPVYTDRDGVLYSADGATLLAYPAGRPTTVAHIPAEVREIGAMAFDTSSRLHSIHYAGSLASWRTMVIGEGNDVLYTLPKSFE